MVVPRTPRPPIIVPKPVERTPDPAEIERWLRRLARSIRLKRRSVRAGNPDAGSSGSSDGGAERH
jgi:hypothetical protein